MKGIIISAFLILSVVICTAQQEKRFRYPEAIELRTAEYVPPPIYSYEYLKTPYGNALDPFEIAYIDLIIKNSGEGPGENIKLEVKSTQPIKGFKIKYPIDIFDINPGESAVKRIELTGDIDLETQNTKIEINVFEPRNLAPPIPLFPINTARFKEPKLILKEIAFTANDQGIIRKAQGLIVSTIIKNEGIGDAKDVRLKIKYRDVNIEKDKTEFKIDSLMAGESAKIEFRSIPTYSFNEDSIVIELIASESFSKFGFQTTTGVPINSPSAIIPSLSLNSEEETREKTYSNLILSSDVDKNIPETLKKRPNALAVVIGNKDYNKTFDVEFAHNDSKAMQQYLIKAMGFDQRNIIYRENITLSEFRELFGTENDHTAYLYNRSQLKNINEIFIYYSGHGAPDLDDKETEKTGYFLPIDCDPNGVRFGGYSSEIFYNNISKLNIDDITVVLDACFSGQSGNGEYLIEGISAAGIMPRGITNIRNGILLSSSEGSQVSNWYSEKQHGLFTYYFLKSFQDLSRDNNNITFKQTIDYLNYEVPLNSPNISNRDQNPTFIGNNFDKLLFQKN